MVAASVGAKAEMESVFYDARRLLDVPAHTRMLLSNEGRRINLEYPVMAGLSTFKQPLLIAAETCEQTAGGSARPQVPPSVAKGPPANHPTPTE
eukprot:11616458-Alexandrium_andersonii.AAC.1